MPNQSDPNQNQPANQPADPAAGTAPPVIPPQMDLPPLPSEPSTKDGSTPVATPASSAPDPGQNVSPDQNTSPSQPETTKVVGTKPKKKFGGGKIIATILGILLLVGGIGAGYILTQQPQIFQGKAWIPQEHDDPNQDPGNPGQADNPKPEKDEDGGGGGGGGSQSDEPGVGEFGYVYPGQLDNDKPYIAGTYIAPNGQRYLVGGSGANDTLAAAAEYCSSHTCDTSDSGLNFSPSTLDQIHVYQTTGDTGSGLGPINCSQTSWAGSVSGTVTEPCPGGGYLIEKTNGSQWCTVDNANCSLGGSDGGGEETPGSTPTPQPPAISCSAVTTYRALTDLHPLTLTELSALSVGDTVNFCVSGSGATTPFDKAQFRINGAVLPETTTQKPYGPNPLGFEIFCQEYTILSSDTTVTVNARIHHAANNEWVGETF